MIKKRELVGLNTKATLNVRSGYRYSINPIPTPNEADSISTEIKDLFSQWQDSYTRVVAKSANVNTEDLHFDPTQAVRIVLQGTTRIIDYPLLNYNNGTKSFDTRVSIALCTGNTSTKAWARASLPVGIDGRITPLELDYVKDLQKSYENISSSSIDWISQNIPNVVNKYLNQPAIDRGRFIRISILSVNDENIAKPFIDLCANGTTAANILEDREIDNKLTFYYRHISDLEGKLSDYANKNNVEPSLLFKLCLWVTLQNGDMEQRTVLFLLREKEFTEIIGLAYDDSIEMDISLRAGAKISRMIGLWI